MKKNSVIPEADRALLEAVADADLSAVRTLIAQGAALDTFIPLKNRAFMGARMGTPGNTPLGIALRERASESTFLDLSNHADPSAREREAEARKKRAALLEIIEALTQAGADLHFVSTPYQGRSPICAAAANNDLEVLEIFSRQGAKLDGTGALHHAANEGSVEAVKILLAAGCDANEKLSGMTPIEMLEARAKAEPQWELDTGDDEVSEILIRRQKERVTRRNEIAELLRKAGSK